MDTISTQRYALILKGSDASYLEKRELRLRCIRTGTIHERAMMLPLNKGLVHLISARSAAGTMSILEGIVLGKGLRVMARVDHAREAEEAGLKMLPAAVLIFGNPHSGTPVMIASPTAAIDLPLKVLVWQDVEGRVWISYNSPRYLKERHEIPESVLGNLVGIESICDEAASSPKN